MKPSLDWRVVTVGVLAGVFMMFRLGDTTIRDYDEGIYATVAQNILRTGDWLTLRQYDSALYFNKPPLTMWMTAALYDCFGVTEFWTRFPSAVAGIFVIVLTFVLARMLYDGSVALLALAPLLTSFEFLYQARLGQTDVILTLFIYLGIYAYLRVRMNAQPRWWWLFWITFGLGVMTKSAAAAVLPAAVAMAIALDGRIKETLRAHDFWIGIALFIVVTGPWHLAMYLSHGHEFTDRYVLYTLVKRAGMGLEGNIGGSEFYLRVFARRYVPWFLLIPFAVAFGLRDSLSTIRRPPILLLFSAVVFLLYSAIVQTKIPQYITPMFPALAILSGAVMAEGLRSPRGIAFVGLGFVAAGAILDPRIPPTVRSALLGSVLVIAALIWCARLAATHISIARLPMIAPTAVAARSIGFVMPFLTAPLHEFLRRLVALSICLFLVGCGAARLRGLYFFLSPTPLERIATAAASNIGGDTILGLVLDRKDGVSIFGPTLAFYSQRPVRVAWGLENLRLLTSDSSDMEIILDRRFMEDLSDKYTFVVLKEEPPFVWTRIRRVSSAE